MIKHIIRLYSKDKKLLHHLLEFIKRSTKTQNLQLSSNLLRKKKTKKKVTVLKSPHVNKTAQEQFGYSVHSVEMLCYSWEIKKYLIALKKIRNFLFPGVKIQISRKFSGTSQFLKEWTFNPLNLTFYVLAQAFSKQKREKKILNSSKSVKKINLLKKTLSYLVVLDCYGN